MTKIVQNRRFESLTAAVNTGAFEIVHDKRAEGLARIAQALGELRDSVDAVHEDEFNVTPCFGAKQQELRQTPNIFLFPFLVDSNVAPCFFGALCGVACYNMAVAYHAEAMSTSSSQERSELLKCAKGLYLQADELLGENPSFLEPQGTLVYVFLAICHNLQAIIQELGGDAESRQEHLVNAFVFCLAENHDNPTYRFFAAAAAV